MRILISGAGVAGPTLAYFLAKSGAKVTVFEKSHALLPYGQNIDVDGSALKVIKKMGLMDELRRYNTTEKGTQFIGPNGKPYAILPVRENATASMTAETEILRGDLSLICYEASKTLANVEYKFGTTISEVLSNDSSAVTVRTSLGGTETFDLLVAADGQWSKVRRQCFSPDTVQVVDKGMYGIYFTIPRLSEDNDLWNIYQALRSRGVTIRPDPHGTVRAMFTIMPRTPAQKEEWAATARSDRLSQNKLVRREFADAGWQVPRLLDAMEDAPDFYFQQIAQIRLSKWSCGRVVCIGDSAYAPTPLTGAGANLALLGAYVLAGELSKLEDGEHPKRALEAYEGALRSFVEETQQIPSIFPGAAHPETSLQRWLFRMIMSMVARIIKLPWIANKTPKIDDEDFKMPYYQFFDEKVI